MGTIPMGEILGANDHLHPPRSSVFLQLHEPGIAGDHGIEGSTALRISNLCSVFGGGDTTRKTTMCPTSDFDTPSHLQTSTSKSGIRSPKDPSHGPNQRHAKAEMARKAQAQANAGEALYVTRGGA